MNEYPPSSPSCRSLTRTAHHPEDRLVTTLFYLPTYLSTYLTLSLSLSLSLYVSSTNFDNCGCQNPTTFFSCELDGDDDDDGDSSAFLKTIVVIFSFDNPVAYLTNVSNNEIDIV